MESVQYWKTKDAVMAKVTKNKEGALVMQMEGESQPFPGFPRGHLLFGTLSKLKHEIKVRLFNDNWWKYEAGATEESIAKDFKQDFKNDIVPIVHEARFDMVPPTRMFGAVREIYRTLEGLESLSRWVRPLKEVMTYILQEDDAYRFRFQWMVDIHYYPLNKDPIKSFNEALVELENAEVVGDMKLRVKLFRDIFNILMEDKRCRELFLEFYKRVDWKKIKLSKADKYHFRGKWFKVDWHLFSY